MSELSKPEARRLALAAHGLGITRRNPATSDIAAVIDGLGVLQLDSVNVFERSHYLPLYARLGRYDTALADDLLLAHSAHPTHVEYWAHVAAFIPVESWPLWRWKMRQYEARSFAAGAWGAEHRAFVDEMFRIVEAEGPITASDIEHDRNKRTGAWWGWSDTKIALETLFDAGLLTSAGRRGFQRLYAVPERVLSSDVLNTHIDESDAVRELVHKAVTAVGVGTEADIADYFRLAKPRTRQALAELVEAGRVVPTTVEGWASPAFTTPGAQAPAAMKANTILTPFDPVTWHRERALRLFDFDYKIEIYTPAAKRQFGYYSLPVLMDDRLVARIDLKADRKTKTLIVKSAHWEPSQPRNAVDRLERIVRDAAAWRGLENIVVDDWGDASRDLRAVFG